MRMKGICFWLLGSLLAVSLVSGCQKSSKEDPSGEQTTVEKPKDPEERLYEQVRSGAFQLTTALDSVQKAMQQSRTLADSSSGELKEAMLDVADHLDAAGSSITDYTTAPVKLEEFRKNFSENDDKRLKAIEVSNTALMDTSEADGIVESLLQNDKFKAQAELRTLSNVIGAALDALEGAIKVMGGKLDMNQPVDGQPSRKSKKTP